MFLTHLLCSSFAAVVFDVEKYCSSSVQKHHDFLQLMVDAQGGGLRGSSEVSQDAEDKLYNLGTELAVEQTADLKGWQHVSLENFIIYCGFLKISCLITSVNCKF